MESKHPKIFIICGKARHGKDTIGGFIKDYYDKKNQKGLRLAYGDYIKNYAKAISGWDGNEETKPRELLQKLGTDIIRNDLGSMFFVEKMCDDIKVYSYFMDYLYISDGRFHEEVDTPRDVFDNVIVIRVNRKNFVSPLTIEQQNHLTETALDDYDNYDYVIDNSGTLDELKDKVFKILEEVENHES